MVGDNLSHYRILRLLGQGGMGAVYLAEDLRLGRKVALKVMLPEIATHEKRLQRFLREARLSSSISHPNVTAFYEIGEENGVHFLAMEYVEGNTLRGKVAGAPLELDEALRIARQVAEALIAAHKTGVIHRDIKPENVMLTTDGHVKVLDFGLARRNIAPEEGVSSDEQVTKTQLSMVGQPIGTVSYMSPEQLRGQKVDGRSDIFAVGVLLFEMLAGRRPFEATSTIGTMQRILTTPPDALARFNYDVPLEVERVIRKCLEKDPEWRYQSARELAVDLAALEREKQSGTLSATHSPLPLIPEPKPVQRRWWIAAGIGLIAIAGAWGAYRLMGPDQVDSLAILPFTNASGDAAIDYVGAALPDGLQRALARIPRLSLTSRGAIRALPTQNPLEAGKKFNVEAVLSGRIGKRRNEVTVDVELMDTRSGAVLWSRDYARAEAQLLNLEEMLGRDLSSYLRPGIRESAAKAQPSDSEAYSLYLKGRYHFERRSLDDMNAAARLFQQATEKDPGLAIAHAGLADTYAVMADLGLQAPATMRRQARAAARRAIELDPTIAEAQTSYAVTTALGEYEWAEAERAFRRAIDLQPDYALAHSWLAVTVLAPMGRQDEALIEINRAIELEPQNPVFRLINAVILFAARRFEDSAKAATFGGDEAPPALKVVQALQFAEARTAQGRLDEAIATLEGAKLDTGQIANSSKGALAYAYALKGRTKQALALDAELERASQFQYVAPCGRVATYVALGQSSRALQLLRNCYEVRESSFVFLKVDSRYDPLRKLPEFQELVRLARLE